MSKVQEVDETFILYLILVGRERFHSGDRSGVNAGWWRESPIQIDGTSTGSVSVCDAFRFSLENMSSNADCNWNSTWPIDEAERDKVLDRCATDWTPILEHSWLLSSDIEWDNFTYTPKLNVRARFVKHDAKPIEFYALFKPDSEFKALSDLTNRMFCGRTTYMENHTPHSRNRVNPFWRPIVNSNSADIVKNSRNSSKSLKRAHRVFCTWKVDTSSATIDHSRQRRMWHRQLVLPCETRKRGPMEQRKPRICSSKSLR